MEWIDTHAHVSDPKFNKDRDEVIARAREAGFVAIVDVGTDLTTSRRAIRLAEREPLVFAAVGVHPYDADRFDRSALEALRELSTAARVVAIGEIGFDFYRDRSSPEGQERCFRQQLEVALERDLPVILHLRSAKGARPGGEFDAYAAARRVLAEFEGKLRGISHCFSADRDTALAMCEAGLHVSFAGNVTYPRNAELREAARAVPLERLLVETDCPYLAPQPRRGTRNEPEGAAITGASIAKVRDMPLEALAAATTANAKALFRLPLD